MHVFQQVWQHKLGTPAAEDSYVIGRISRASSKFDS